MTLTTHSIIAVAVTKPLMRMHPVLIFAVAILTHYLSDAIPHWDYKILSLENAEDKEHRHISNNHKLIITDIRNFAIDGFLGAAIVLLAIRPVTPQQWMWAGLAVVGGCLPDFLQALHVLKLPLLRLHQKFHDIFHTNIRLSSYPLLGIPFQAAIVATALFVLVGRS